MKKLSLLFALTCLPFVSFGQTAFDVLWNTTRQSSLQAYLGSEAAWWFVDFAEGDGDLFSSTPPPVDRTPFVMAVGRLSLDNFWGFSAQFELKANDADLSRLDFVPRFEVGTGGGNSGSFRSKITRSLGLLTGWIPWVFPEVPLSWMDKANLVQWEFQSLIRKYNWTLKRAGSLVDFQGNYLPNAVGSTWPADTQDQKWVIKTGIIEWLMPDDLRKTAYGPDARRDLEDFAGLTMWPSLGFGWRDQVITTPMQILVSNYFLYLNGGTLDSMARKDFQSTFITRNRFSGFDVVFRLFDVDLAPPDLPLGINLQYEGAFGKTWLETALFNSTAFDALRHEISLEFYFRPIRQFWAKFGANFMTYDYTPIEILTNNESVTVKRAFTDGTVSFSPGERLGLDFFRGETFFSLQFEASYRY